MDCYIIDRKLSNEEIQLIANIKESEVLLTSKSYLENKIKNKFLTEISDDEKKDINYNILDEILRFSSLNFQNKPILEYLKKEQFNLWFYHKFRIYLDIRNNYYEIAKIRKLEKSFEKIIVYTSNLFIKTYKGFENTTIIKYSKSKNKLNKITLILFGLMSGFRLIKGLFSYQSYKNHILIVDSRNHYKNMMDISGEKVIYENTYNGYLYDKIKLVNFALIDTLPIPKFIGKQYFKFEWNKIVNIHHRNRIYEEIILWKGFFNKKLKAKRKEGTDIFLQRLNTLYHSLDLNPIQELIIWRLKKLNKSTSLYYFKYLSYQQFFAKYKYPILVSIDEYSANIKLIHDAAKTNSMKTIGIQHGTMHELHPGYVYSKAESDTNPYPDLTILWGERWKLFLQEKGNYAANSLKISGQIRTDVINNLIQKKEEIKNKIGLPNKKILLFASQPQPDPKLRQQIVYDIFNIVKTFDEVLLVLKPHPREIDLNYFIRLAKSAECENYRMITDVDLYQLLIVSDYVITNFSTVGTETVYFKKPLIIYDPLNQDVVKYIEDKVGIQAKNCDELITVLKGLVNNSISIDKQIQEEFVLKNAYKIDGKVCERIKQELKRE